MNQFCLPPTGCVSVCGEKGAANMCLHLVETETARPRDQDSSAPAVHYKLQNTKSKVVSFYESRTLFFRPICKLLYTFTHSVDMARSPREKECRRKSEFYYCWKTYTKCTKINGKRCESFDDTIYIYIVVVAYRLRIVLNTAAVEIAVGGFSGIV